MIKTNQDDHLKMNSNIPAEKGLGPGSACAGLCMSAYRQGGKVLTDSCCYCISLAPNFLRVFKFICQRLPDSRTGLAIRTVCRKLCVLGSEWALLL